MWNPIDVVFWKVEYENDFYIKLKILGIDANGDKKFLHYSLDNFFLVLSKENVEPILRKAFPVTKFNVIKIRSDCLSHVYSFKERLNDPTKTNVGDIYLVVGSLSIALFCSFNPKYFLDVTFYKSEDTEIKTRTLFSLMDKDVKDGIHFYYRNTKGRLYEELKYRKDCKSMNIRVAYFDIEVFTDVTCEDYLYRFPNGYLPDDKICMISCIYDEDYVVWYWGLDNVLEKYDKYRFVYCSDEKKMLLNFMTYIKQVDPLFLVCYNGYSYDVPCIMASIYHKFGVETFERTFSSMKIGVIDVPIIYETIIPLDYYLYVKRYSGLDLSSWKLNDVAEHKVGEKKVEINIVSLQRIFQNFYTKEDLDYGGAHMSWDIKYPIKDVKHPSSPLKCIFYCGEDSRILKKCFEFDKVLVTLYQYSKLIYVNLLDVFFCGNSTLLQKAFKSVGILECNFFFSEYNYKNKNLIFMEDGCTTIADAIEYTGQKSYPGALNYCIPGIYNDNSCLDYFSQYPNSMIVANLSPETIIVSSDPTPYANDPDILVIPYENHENMEDGEPVPEMQLFPDVQPDKHKVFIMCDRKQMGIIPTFSSHLLNLRKIEKKLYKETNEECYNIRQYILKILANSLYGVTGATEFSNALACFVVALATTLIGRYLLKKLKWIVESNGKEVKQADTDGLWIVNCQTKEAQEITDKVNKFFDDINMKNIKVEFEGFFPKVICLTKKKYIRQNDKMFSVAKGFEKKGSVFEKTLLQYCYNRVFTTQELTVESFMKYMVEESHNIKLIKTTKFKSLNEYDMSADSEQIRLVKKSNATGNLIASGDWLSYTYYILDIDMNVANKLNPFLLTKYENHNVDFFKLFKRQELNVRKLISIRNNINEALVNKTWNFYKSVVLTTILYEDIKCLCKILNCNIDIVLFLGVKNNFNVDILRLLASQEQPV